MMTRQVPMASGVTAESSSIVDRAMCIVSSASDAEAPPTSSSVSPPSPHVLAGYNFSPANIVTMTTVCVWTLWVFITIFIYCTLLLYLFWTVENLVSVCVQSHTVITITTNMCHVQNLPK